MISEMSSEITISRSVSLPSDASNLTLSFFYKMLNASSAGGTGLKVQLSEESAVTDLYVSSTNSQDWQHAWAI